MYKPVKTVSFNHKDHPVLLYYLNALARHFDRPAAKVANDLLQQSLYDQSAIHNPNFSLDFTGI